VRLDSVVSAFFVSSEVLFVVFIFCVAVTVLDWLSDLPSELFISPDINSVSDASTLGDVAAKTNIRSACDKCLIFILFSPRCFRFLF
jgi:hypothetical protein